LKGLTLFKPTQAVNGEIFTVFFCLSFCHKTLPYSQENLQENKSFQRFLWKNRTEATNGIFQAILIAGYYPCSCNAEGNLLWNHACNGLQLNSALDKMVKMLRITSLQDQKQSKPAEVFEPH